MNSAQRIAVVALIAVVVGVLIVVGVLREPRQQPKPVATQPAQAAPAGTRPTPTPGAPARPATTTAPPVRVPTPPQRTSTDEQRARAVGLMAQGMQLAQAGQAVKARQALADALNIGALPPQQADAVQAKLAELAQLTLFSTRRYADDPNVLWYRFKPGELLVRVERAQQLHVPTQLLLKINGIPKAELIQAGQTLKLLRGPFHALVQKSKFTMDVYLEETGTKRMVFVKRFRVGTGQDGSTPPGRWRVALGRKQRRAPWTPPVSSSLPRRSILWGQPDYPLGTEGYWIALEGIEPNIYVADDGYGIHGTKDRSSIGRASSMGCIRLSDEDMEEVFSMLYEHWSTVTVLK